MRAIKYWAVVLCVLACCARGNISNRPVSRRHTLRLLSLPRLVRNEECLRGDSVSCARLVLADCRVKKASDADNASGELSADCEDHSSGPSTFIEQVEGLHVQLLDVVLEAVAQTRGVRALRKVVAVSPALRSRVLGSESIWRLLCVDEGFPPLEREVMGAEALDKDDSSFSQHSHGWGEFLWWDESASDKGDGKLTRANLRLTTGTSRGGTRVSRWAAAFARGETQQGRVRHAAELLRAFGGALFAYAPPLSSHQVSSPKPRRLMGTLTHPPCALSCRLNPGLSNSEIAAIERASCLRLPPALRALYREFDGQDRLCLEGVTHPLPGSGLFNGV